MESVYTMFAGVGKGGGAGLICWVEELFDLCNGFDGMRGELVVGTEDQHFVGWFDSNKALIDGAVVFGDSGEVKFERVGKEAVDRDAFGVAVIMSFVWEVEVADIDGCTVEVVYVADVWEFDFGCVFGPVFAN